MAFVEKAIEGHWLVLAQMYEAPNYTKYPNLSPFDLNSLRREGWPSAAFRS